MLYFNFSFNIEDIPPSTKQEIKANLKKHNSDGRERCIACGGNIIEPYPKIRYCPRCE